MAAGWRGARNARIGKDAPRGCRADETHVSLPVAVAEDVAVRPAEPDAVELLVCEAVILARGEGRESGVGEQGRAARVSHQSSALSDGWRQCPHVVVPVAVADEVAVRPDEPEAVDELVCEAVMLHAEGRKKGALGGSPRTPNERGRLAAGGWRLTWSCQWPSRTTWPSGPQSRMQ